MAGGRPRKDIDKSNFEKLCGLQCTKNEIAGFFDVSEDTIDRFCKREYNDSFAVVYKRYSATGRISLRRNQFKLAEKSAAMAIFLGKQYLNQHDDKAFAPTGEGNELLNSIQGILKKREEDSDELE